MYDNNYPNDYEHRNTAGSSAGQSGETSRSSYTGGPGGTTGGAFSSGQTGYSRGAGRSGYGQYGSGGYGAANGSGSYGGYGTGNGSYQYGDTASQGSGQSSSYIPNEPKKKKTSGKGYFKKALVNVSLGLFFGLCAGLGFWAVESATGMFDKVSSQAVESRRVEETEEPAAEPKEDAAKTTSGEDGTNGTAINGTTIVTDVTQVVKEAMPSIVSINNKYTERMSYFGQEMSSEATATGSGIIVGQNETELLIATNYHVVAGADELSVQFTDGEEVTAQFKGSDSDMDLAVIAVPLDKVGGETLSAIAIARMGDSDSLVVGEPAIAIGNALGYGQSVTTGVISALNRVVELSDGSSGTFIQTDAAINPGNSGGALLNTRGELIGINSNKIGGSTIEGMGYAIPISAAKPIIEDLMTKQTKTKVEESEKGYLGITGVTINSEMASIYEGIPEGVYVTRVYEGSPAQEAGLAKGMIITSLNGDKIVSMEDLKSELEFHKAGETIEITVMHGSPSGWAEKTVSLTLGNDSAILQ